MRRLLRRLLMRRLLRRAAAAGGGEEDLMALLHASRVAHPQAPPTTGLGGVTQPAAPVIDYDRIASLVANQILAATPAANTAATSEMAPPQAVTLPDPSASDFLRVGENRTGGPLHAAAATPGDAFIRGCVYACVVCPRVL
jgi:hypothetical protein